MGDEGVEPFAYRLTLGLATVLRTAVRSITLAKSVFVSISKRQRDHGESNPERRIDNAPCCRYTMIPRGSSSRGSRTLSISRSEQEWSANCLSSYLCSHQLYVSRRSGGWNRTSDLHVQSVVWQYQQPPPRSKSPSTRFGKEDSNLHHLSQSQAAYRLANSRVRPVGVEPTYQAWMARTFAARPRTHVETPSRSSPSRLESRKRKRRESNPQGSSLARFRIECRLPSACPSHGKISRTQHKSTGGRTRTSNHRLNKAPPYH